MRYTEIKKFMIFFYTFPVMRDTGADAGTNVPAQGVRALASRLSQNYALPKVAADGRASW